MESPTEPAARAQGPRRAPLILAGGGAIAVILGLSVAMGIFRDDPSDDTPPPASQGGLTVELSEVDTAQLDPARPLRCFVDGKFVAELTLAQCAERNGVAAQALDVGVDASGALAAVVSAEAPPNTEPLATDIVDSVPVPGVDDTPAAPAPVTGAPTGACLRHTGGEWRNLGDALTVDTCVQVLFAGRCEQPGGAQYGRWNGQTVRLVPGRVEIATDGANFRPLVEQDPQSCMIQ